MRNDLERARERYRQWRTRGEGRAYLSILFSMCEGICPICGKPMYLSFGEVKGLPKDLRATFDHIVPLKFTKKHEKTNLMICCYACNNSAGHSGEIWNSTLRVDQQIQNSPRANPVFVEQGLPIKKDL